MKHKFFITALLLSMFLVTQIIGFFVVNAYTPEISTVIDPETGEEKELNTGPELPFGLQIHEDDPEPTFISIIFSFMIAFGIIFLLMKFRWKFLMKFWFFAVVTIALAVSINAFVKLSFSSASTIALVIAIPLALVKIYRPNVYIHNVTELLIYPGIAAIFVPMLNPLTMIGLLILISLYDMWAVWKSGIMIKMAKFQMNELKIFGGFFIPIASKKTKNAIKTMKQKYKKKKLPKSIQKKKYQFSLAALGGGDVVFPIIAAGVFLRAFGIWPAILVTLGAFAGLVGLYIITKKNRAYPAMPYISSGMFVGMIIAKMFFM